MFSLKNKLKRYPYLPFAASLFFVASYCLLVAAFWNFAVPNGEPNVNRIFAGKSLPVLVLLASGVLSVTLLLKKSLRISSENFEQPLAMADGLLMLLPLTPIVQYILLNQDILSAMSSGILAGVFVAIALLITVLVPRIFTGLGLGTASMIAGLAVSFTVFQMATMTHAHGWFASGNLRPQIALLLTVLVLLWVGYGIVGRTFARGVVVAYFVANTAFVGFQLEPPVTTKLTFDGNSQLVALVGARQPKVTPNIYILVYDAYVTNETMLSYGIDNSAQERFLAESGFRLYRHTYSVAAYTVGTMSRLFSVTNTFTGQPRSAAAGNGAVQQLLRGFGYDTYGLFWSDYFFRPAGSFYDHSYPRLQPAHWLVAKAIMMGEFRFDTTFEAPQRADFIAHKVKHLPAAGDGPRLTYMHVDRPNHTQNSGQCLPNEVELYAARLQEANVEMTIDVTAIRQSDPGAIIVVAGDHGPYLTKNCNSTGEFYDKAEITRQDVQDRFGTFLAISWPQNLDTVYDDITLIQDLFPAIFATIFADDRYLNARLKPRTGRSKRASGVSVQQGIIVGGIHHGEPLFLGPKN